MTPGAKSLNEIRCLKDLYLEAEQYLSFLVKRFGLAIKATNKGNQSFKILDDLTVGDIYSEQDLIRLTSLGKIPSNQLDTAAESLHYQIISKNSFSDFLETSGLIAVHQWEVCPDPDEVFVHDPRIRIFNFFGAYYMKRIHELIDDLIERDPIENSYLLFETKTDKDIISWINLKSLGYDPRKKCDLLYKILNKFRDNYLSKKSTPDENDQYGFVDASISYTGYEDPTYGVIFYPPKRVWAKCDEVFRPLYDIAIKNFRKITIRTYRRKFTDEIKMLTRKRQGDIDSYVESTFHFDFEDWTEITHDPAPPIFRGPELGGLLNEYKEGGLLSVKKKDYLINWLCFVGYGWDGYSRSTIKDSFSRATTKTTQKKKRSKKLRELKTAYPGVFDEVKILLHFLN